MSEKADPILLRVMLSGDDFERAGDFVKAARAHPVVSIEYEALLHSAILFYARHGPTPTTSPRNRNCRMRRESSPGLTCPRSWATTCRCTID